MRWKIAIDVHILASETEVGNSFPDMASMILNVMQCLTHCKSDIYTRTNCTCQLDKTIVRLLQDIMNLHEYYAKSGLIGHLPCVRIV